MNVCTSRLTSSRRSLVATLVAATCILRLGSNGKPAVHADRVAAASSTQVADWQCYGGDPGGSRFSPLTQINTTNVQQLKVAWTYHTGDISDGTKHRRKTAFEATP